MLVTARYSHVESVVMVVIIGVSWWNCMSRNLSLSIDVCINRGVIHYKHKEKRCISINRDLRQSVVGSSALEMESSGQGIPQSGKELREVEVSE